MRTLYYSPGACSLAAHIILEEITQPFRTERVAIREGAHLTPEYLALNPHARVPTLVEDGFVLTESPAILSYLGHVAPQAQLLDLDNLRNFGRTAELLNYFSSAVHIAFAQIWRSTRFAQSGAARAEVEQAGLESARRYFTELEELARAGDWLVGNRFSIADPYMLVFYRWGALVGIDMAPYSAWTAHKDRMIERPAVQRALAREQIEID